MTVVGTDEQRRRYFEAEEGLLRKWLDEKVLHVLRQLERGEARIVFDPSSESVQIVLSAGMRAARR